MARWMLMVRVALALSLLLPGGVALAEDDESSLDSPVVAGFDEDKGEEKPAAEAEEKAGDLGMPEPELKLHTPIRFYSAGPGGEAGLMRVHEAFGGPPMSMRLSLHGGFFTSSSFLNYLNEAGYSEANVQGRLGLSFTPIEYLEAFINLRSTSNKNSSSSPGLLQTQGDLEFGLKGIYPVLPYLGLGLDAAVGFTNGIGDVSPKFAGTNFRTALLLSFDARPLMKELPLRAHLNAGFMVENSDALEGNRQLTWIEQYALNVAGYHRVSLGLGIDAPLAYTGPVGITPFVEYTVEIPIGVSRADLDAASLGTATSLGNVVPMRLTPGVRVTYLTDISLDIAVDIGLGGKKAYIDGVPSSPPWTMWFGLTYAFDPTQSGGPGAPDPVIVMGKVVNNADDSPLGGATITFAGNPTMPVASEFEGGRYVSQHAQEGKVLVTCSKDGFASESHEVAISRDAPTRLDFSLVPEPVVEAPPPVVSGKVVGRVINAADMMPIAHAIISFNGAGLTPVASDDMEGKYTSYDLPPGLAKLTAAKKGFKALTQEVEVKLGESAILDFSLESDIKLATLSGKVTDEKDKPIAAKVRIDGPQPQELTTSADAGDFKRELTIGSYAVMVSAEGYMTKGRRIELKEDQSVLAEFKLSPRPKRQVVILQVKQKKIAVRKKIHFESGKTTLRADAHQILDGVVEVLVTHPELKKIRIEGHTDSIGSNRLNEQLSQGRADSVMGYLVGQGIDASRLEAKGFGEVKPIAPNSSRRGREQNRRVEFMIVE